jgi:hypothetical protein
MQPESDGDVGRFAKGGVLRRVVALAEMVHAVTGPDLRRKDR